MLLKTNEQKLKHLHLSVILNQKERISIWQKAKGIWKNKKLSEDIKTLRQEWDRKITK